MLPIIRLTQTNTPLIVRQATSPGRWVLYRDTGEFTVLNRFKMLVLAHRQIMVHFDLFQSHYVTARQGELVKWQGLVAAKLSGKNVRDGLETLVWLPHYRELAVVQLTANSGVRAFRNLTVAELYGVGSRITSAGGRSFYVPSPERLNLPVVMDERLMNPDRNMVQDEFISGLPV